MSKHSATRTVVAAAILMVVGATGLFATGTAEAATTSPELVWVTAVQGGRTPDENILFQDEVERLTGTKVTIIKPAGSEYNTKLTTMLSTGEQVDIAYMGAASLAAYRQENEDLFTPLTSMIMESDVLTDPTIIPMSEWNRIRSEDGEIYGVFNKFEQGTLPIVRRDWMNKLGLEDPETLDDYYQLLKAFKEQDPDGNGQDDTWGLAIGYVTYDLSPFFGAYGLPRGYAVDENGNTYAPWATETAIPVYEFMNRLYEEEILEPNFITNNSANFRDLFMTDKSGMSLYWAAWVGLYNQQVKSENPNSPFMARGLVPPEGPGGRLLRAGGDGLMVNPSYSEYTDEAFGIMEFWHTYDGNVLSSLGIQGHDWTMENGTYTLTEIGESHAMDHGAPQPKSLAWENPIGENEGFDEAAAIVREYGVPEMVTAHNAEFEEVVRSEAARIILGEISAREGVANMQQRLRDAGVID